MQIKSWNDANTAMEALAAADARLRKLAAEKDAEVLAIERRYAARLTELTDSIEQLEAALRKFAQSKEIKPQFKAKEDGGEGRTRIHSGVEIGFQWGQPYLHIPKKFEEEAIAWLEQTAEDTYVKRSPKIMREVLSAELAKAEAEKNKAFTEKMAAHHITREQDEEFVLKIANSE